MRSIKVISLLFVVHPTGSGKSFISKTLANVSNESTDILKS
jgi:ATP-dependent protease Clp ATPase subunit